MRVAATETPEKEVFTLDPKKSLKKSFLWMLGQLVFVLLAGWGVSSHTAWGMFFAALSIPATLLCAFMAVFTITRRQHSRIEIVENELCEYFGSRLSERWNLPQARKLSSIRFTKNPSDDTWFVRYDEGIHMLILKREWLEFDTLLRLIEELSNLKFAEEIDPIPDRG